MGRHQVRKGMQTDEVFGILGEPSDTTRGNLEELSR